MNIQLKPRGDLPRIAATLNKVLKSDRPRLPLPGRCVFAGPKQRSPDRPMPRTARPIEIHKFGGASLASGAAIAQAVAIVRARRPAPVVVVVSAMAGVTDALLDLAAAAIQRGPDGARTTVDALCAQHLGAVRALLGPGPRTDELIQTIERAFAEVEPLAAGLRILRELTPRTTDYLVARGEQLSARMVAAALDSAGCPATYVDAAAVIQTDGTFGNASPDLAGTERSARRVLRPLLARGVVPVIPGFLGAAPDGQVATLGRGGSDLTATLLARALGAARVVLWKDVPGILTADPRAVPDARLVPQLHHREAAEVAYFGAKVLHPRALIPLDGSRITLDVRSFLDPGRPGTEVSARRTLEDYPVKALATIKSQALVTVVGSGMAGTPGISARVFSALAAGGVNVIAIAQGSSELNISFVVEGGQTAEAARRVHAAFQLSKIGGGRSPEAPRTDVVLLGFGRVGRALADQLAARNGGSRGGGVAGPDRPGHGVDPRRPSPPRPLRPAH